MFNRINFTVVKMTEHNNNIANLAADKKASG